MCLCHRSSEIILAVVVNKNNFLHIIRSPIKYTFSTPFPRLAFNLVATELSPGLDYANSIEFPTEFHSGLTNVAFRRLLANIKFMHCLWKTR